MRRATRIGVQVIGALALLMVIGFMLRPSEGSAQTRSNVTVSLVDQGDREFKIDVQQPNVPFDLSSDKISYSFIKSQVLKIPNGDPGGITFGFPDGEDLREKTIQSAEVTFDDSTLSIVFTSKNSLPFETGISEAMLILDWSGNGQTPAAPTVALGLKGNIEVPINGTNVDVNGQVTVSNNKLAIRNATTKAVLVPSVVEQFLDGRTIDSLAIPSGVQFVGKVNASEVVGELAKPGTQVEVSGTVVTDAVKFLNAGKIDTSKSFTVTGSIQPNQLAFPGAIKAERFELSVSYQVPAPPKTTGVTTITATGKVSVDDDRLGGKVTLIASASVDTSKNVTLSAKYKAQTPDAEGAWNWAIPGTNEKLFVKAVSLEVKVGPDPSFTIAGTIRVADIDVTLELSASGASNSVDVSLRVNGSIQSFANVGKKIVGNTETIDLGAFGETNINALAELQLKDQKLSFWVAVDVAIKDKTIRLGAHFSKSDIAVALKFPSNVTLGDVLPDLALDEATKKIPLPEVSIIVSNGIPKPFVDSSSLSETAKSFLAPFYGCAEPSACTDKGIAKGIELQGEIRFAGLDKQLETLWITDGAPLRVSAKIDPSGLELKMALPTIAPPELEVRNTPWWVGLDASLTAKLGKTGLDFTIAGDLEVMVPDPIDGKTAAELEVKFPERRGASTDTFDKLTIGAEIKLQLGAESSISITGDVTGWESPFGAKWFDLETAVVQIKTIFTPTPALQLGFRLKVDVNDTIVDGSAAISVGPAPAPAFIKVEFGFRLYVEQLALSDVMNIAKKMGIEQADPNDVPPVVLKNLELSFATPGINSPRLCLQPGFILGGEVHLVSEAEAKKGIVVTPDDDVPVESPQDCGGQATSNGLSDDDGSCTDTCLGKGRIELTLSRVFGNIAVRDLEMGPVDLRKPTFLIDVSETRQIFRLSGGITVEGFVEADGLVELGSDGHRFNVLVKEEGATNPSESWRIDAFAGLGPLGIPNSFSFDLEVTSDLIGEATQAVSSLTGNVANAFGLPANDVVRFTCGRLVVDTGGDVSDGVPRGSTAEVEINWLQWPNGNISAAPQPKNALVQWDFDKDIVANVAGIGQVGVNDGSSCSIKPDFNKFGIAKLGAVFLNTSCRPTQVNGAPASCQPATAPVTGVETLRQSMENNVIDDTLVGAEARPAHVFQARPITGCGICASITFTHGFGTPGFGSYYAEYQEVDAGDSATIVEGEFFRGTVDNEFFVHQPELELKMGEQTGFHYIRMRLWDARNCVGALSPDVCIKDRADADDLLLAESTVGVFLWETTFSDIQLADVPVVFEGDPLNFTTTYVTAPNTEISAFGGNLLGSLPGTEFVSRSLSIDDDRRVSTTTFSFDTTDDFDSVIAPIVVDVNTEVARGEPSQVKVVNRAPYPYFVRYGGERSNNTSRSTRSPAEPWEGPNGAFARPFDLGLGSFVLTADNLGAVADNEIELLISFQDAGLNDTHTVEVTTSDGSHSVHDMPVNAIGFVAEEPIVHRFVDGYPDGPFEMTIVVRDDDGGEAEPIVRTLTIVPANDDIADAIALENPENDLTWTARGSTLGATDQSGAVSDASLDTLDGACIVWFEFAIPDLPRLGDNLSFGTRRWFQVRLDGRSNNSLDPINLAVAMPRNNVTGSANEGVENLFDIPSTREGGLSPRIPTEQIYTLRTLVAGATDDLIKFGVYTPGGTAETSDGSWTDPAAGCGDDGTNTGPFTVTFEAVPPTNDDLAEAIGIELGSTVERLVEQVNLHATDEVDENQILAQSINGAVWYVVDSPYANARVQVNTAPSDPSKFVVPGLPPITQLDSVMAVYEGPDAADHGDLTLAGQNDDTAVESCSLCSSVLVEPSPNGTHYVAVGGFDRDGTVTTRGMFDLEVQALSTPATSSELGFVPDLPFQVFPGGEIVGANVGADLGNARHEWTFVAPVNGTIEINGSGDGFTPGSAEVLFFQDLDPASDPNANGGATVKVTKGAAYVLRFEGADGDFTLDIEFAVTNHDDIRDALPVPIGGDATLRTGPSRTVGNGLVGSDDRIASRDLGEPDHAGLSNTDHTVWLTMTPTESGLVRLSTTDADFDTVLAVYLGDTLESLTEVASGDDTSDTDRNATVDFMATAGQKYSIALSGYGASTGRATVTAELVDPVDPVDPVGSFEALVPGRLMDSRPGENTIDNLFAGDGLLTADTIVELDVTGRAGVPTDASAVMLNVTVTDTRAPGFITVFPCGQPQPLASNLNYGIGTTIPNAVVAAIGTDGKVCFFTKAATHLIIDVNGAFP